MTYAKQDIDYERIPQEKIDKLTSKIAKSLLLDEQVASSLIYKEWDVVESLFQKYKKVKTVHQHFLDEIKGEYRGFAFSV